MTANGYEISFGNEKNVIKFIVMMGADLMNILKHIEFLYL